MNNKETPNNLHIYQDRDHEFSRAKILSLIEQETRSKYIHLNPKFYPDNCMQAKIRLNVTDQSFLSKAPQEAINILSTEKFYAETFQHFNDNGSGQKDGQQFVLQNKEMEKIGFKFVLKATFGPSFISIWFRNDSDNPRMDLPIFYALEILNRIQHKVDTIKITGDSQSLDTQTDQVSAIRQ